MYNYEDDYDEYENIYEFYEDYEYDDPNEYWFGEWEVSTVIGGGFSSVSSLMPIIAIVVSVGMLLIFLNFVLAQMPEVDNLTVVNQTRLSANSDGKIASLFTPSIRYWESEIVGWANKWGIDPNLIATVMQIESCGNPKAVSVAGAMGLFQVMPFHFKGSEDPYHPDTNALRGMSYLLKSLNSFNGNIKLGLAGYNAGISGASREETLWPAETIRYTAWGVGIYEDAKTSKGESATLNEWLSRGGRNMCNTAEKKLGIAP